MVTTGLYYVWLIRLRCKFKTDVGTMHALQVWDKCGCYADTNGLQLMWLLYLYSRFVMGVFAKPTPHKIMQQVWLIDVQTLQFCNKFAIYMLMCLTAIYSAPAQQQLPHSQKTT